MDGIIITIIIIIIIPIQLWIRTQNFHLKLLDTTVTLKYNKGHPKWYEWVKLNEYFYHAKIDIYHIYSVQENLNVTVFATNR